MILHLRGSVGNKMVDSLVESINNLRKEDNLCIYFTSPGGETDSAEALIDIINKHASVVGMVFYGDIFSAAMDIFLRVNCHKELLRDVRGMYHFSYQDISISEGGRPSTISDSFYMKEMRKAKQRTMTFVRNIGFTAQEISGVRRSTDVYFSAERMQQLIDGRK